jgi:hypothetical protein
MRTIVFGSTEYSAAFSIWPEHWQALMRTAAAGGVRLLMVVSSTRASDLRPALKDRTQPTIVLIGDDPGVSRGPRNWPTARLLTRWATAACVVGAAAEIDRYTALPSEARGTGGRMVLVESDAAHAPAWAGLFVRAGAGVLLVLPEDGVHPVPPSAAEVH